MPEIKQYNYKLFTIDVCQNCFDYKVNHQDNMVFHGIDSSYLERHKNGILTPEGIADANYYHNYLKTRKLHLGPLYICGLMEKNPYNIWFGFDINEVQLKYPDLKFINYNVWEILAFHTHTLPIEEKINEEKNLLLDKYYKDNPTTEILLNKELDCNLAKIVIMKKYNGYTAVKRFLGKNLEFVVFNNSNHFWLDYINHLDIECDCNIAN